ncbi:MAG: hypothetical protein BM560_13830 [Roseobacter sp. MedPE-SWde]|nr:MAG: hypothetical protein BM560_13830 [Roseobacter sp. MedPE-SWde]
MKPTRQTRNDLLKVARRHFAERGYQGTSLADVAAELGVSKQALLHHFKSKPLLYRACLDLLNQDLLHLLFTAMEGTEDADLQLERCLVALTEYYLEDGSAPALVMGILTDAPGQVALSAAPPLPLQDFLEPLVALVQATPRWQGGGFAEALAVAIELLGAICLLSAARKNLSDRFGVSAVEQGRRLAVEHARDLVRVRLGG